MKKLLTALLTLCLVLTVTGCKKETKPEEVTYTRADDEEVYAAVLGTFAEKYAEARAEADDNKRFLLYAEAEAYLLDAAVMVPSTTKGGAYTISRVAPRTVPYVQWGSDSDRWYGMVIADQFLTPAERNELIDLWQVARGGGKAYDPIAWLQSKGYKVAKDYKTTFSTAPETLDICNTSMQSDTEILVQCIDGLVEYDNLGRMQPAIAESWEVSEDGMVYTFHLRDNAYWFTSEGAQYAPVTAEDFVAGFQHMLDGESGLDYLVDGTVKGVHEYLAGGDFSEVGYVAKDAQTLEITLAKPASYFPTMLTYSVFAPISKQYFESHGGVLGHDFAEASGQDSYTFGKNTDVASNVYNGPYLLQKLEGSSEIKVVKNPNYYNTDKVVLDSITWIYDNGENMEQFYKDVQNGTYAGCGLTEASGTLKWAKEDGSFDKYAYVSDTDSTTYLGGINVNRGTFGLSNGNATSPKTEQQKIDTEKAMLNANFRKAILFGFDKKTYNAVSRGEDLAATNLRNMYTSPNFVQLSADTTDKYGDTFKQGTSYGEMVQHYCDKIGLPIDTADMKDGWYNKELAQQYLAKAKEELGDTVTWPIQLDIVYYSPSTSNTATMNAVKEVLEGSLGTENVVVNMLETTTSDDYYAGTYRAADGAANLYDFGIYSGWGPDYGDPSTYLETFLYDGSISGYMLKIIGITL